MASIQAHKLPQRIPFRTGLAETVHVTAVAMTFSKLLTAINMSELLRSMITGHVARIMTELRFLSGILRGTILSNIIHRHLFAVACCHRMSHRILSPFLVLHLVDHECCLVIAAGIFWWQQQVIVDVVAIAASVSI